GSASWKAASRFFRMHWDREPAWAFQSAAEPAHSKTWRKCAQLWPTRQRLGVRRTSAAFNESERAELVRFIECPNSLAAVHWYHNPTPNPSQEGTCQGAPDARSSPETS